MRSYRKRLSGLRDEQAAVAQEVVVEKQARDDRMMQIQQEKEELEKNYRALEQSNKELLEVVQNHASQIQKHGAEADELEIQKSTIAALQERLQDQHHEIFVMKTMSEDYSDQSIAAKQQIRTLQSQVAQHQETLEGMRNRLMEESNEVLSLRGDQKSVSDQESLSKVSLATATMTLPSDPNQTAELQQTIASLRTELVEAEETSEGLRHTLSLLVRAEEPQGNADQQRAVDKDTDNMAMTTLQADLSDQNAELQQTISSLHTELAEAEEISEGMQQKLTHESGEVLALRNRKLEYNLADADEENELLAAMTDLQASMREQNEGLQQTITSLRAQLVEAEATSKGLQHTLAQESNEILKLKEQNLQQHTEVQQSDNTVHTELVQAKEAEFAMTIQAKEAELATLQSDLRGQNAALQQTNSSLRIQLNQANVNLEGVCNALKHESSEVKMLRGQHDANNDAVQQRFSDQEAELLAMTTKQSGLRNQNGELQQTVNSLRLELVEVKKTSNRLSDTITQESSEIRRLEQTLERNAHQQRLSNKEADLLNNDNASMTNLKSQLSDRNSELQQTNNSLRMELAHAKETSETWRQALTQESREVERIREQKYKSGAVQDDQETELLEMNRLQSELRIQNTELQRTIDSLSMQLIDVGVTSDGLQQNLKLECSEVQSHKMECKAFRERVVQTESQLSNSHDQNSELQTTIQDLHAKLGQVQDHTSHHEVKTYDSLELKCAFLQEDNERQRDQLTCQDRDLETLHLEYKKSRDSAEQQKEETEKLCNEESTVQQRLRKMHSELVASEGRAASQAICKSSVDQVSVLAMQKQIDMYKVSLAAKTESISEVEAQLAAAKAENSEKGNGNEAKESVAKEITKLREALSAKSASTTEFEQQLAVAKADKLQVTSEAEEFQGSAKRFQAECNEITQKWKTEVADLRENLSDTKTKAQAERDQVSTRWEAEVKDLRAEVNSLKQQHISDLSFFEDLKKRYAHGHAQLQQTWADRLQDRGASLNRFGETDSSKPSSDAKGEVPPGAQSPDQQEIAGTARSSDEQFETVKGVQLVSPASPALVKGREPIPGPRALNEAQVVELRTAKLTSIMSKMEQELSKELSVQVKNTRDASQEKADTKSTPSWTPTVTVKHKPSLVKPGVGKVVPAVRPFEARERERSFDSTGQLASTTASTTSAPAKSGITTPASTTDDKSGIRQRSYTAGRSPSPHELATPISVRSGSGSSWISGASHTPCLSPLSTQSPQSVHRVTPPPSAHQSIRQNWQSLSVNRSISQPSLQAAPTVKTQPNAVAAPLSHSASVKQIRAPVPSPATPSAPVAATNQRSPSPATAIQVSPVKSSAAATPQIKPPVSSRIKDLITKIESHSVSIQQQPKQLAQPGPVRPFASTAQQPVAKYPGPATNPMSTTWRANLLRDA